MNWFHTRSWLVVGFVFLSLSLNLSIAHDDEWMDYMCFRVVFALWNQISSNLIYKISLYGRLEFFFCDLSDGGQCTNLPTKMASNGKGQALHKMIWIIVICSVSITIKNDNRHTFHSFFISQQYDFISCGWLFCDT